MSYIFWDDNVFFVLFFFLTAAKSLFFLAPSLPSPLPPTLPPSLYLPPFPPLPFPLFLSLIPLSYRWWLVELGGGVPNPTRSWVSQHSALGRPSSGLCAPCACCGGKIIHLWFSPTPAVQMSGPVPVIHVADVSIIIFSAVITERLNWLF